VADCVRDDDDESVARDIGRAAAYYLETTLNQGECIGISSWSGTILAMVDVMRQIPRPIGAQVIQILGGAGEPQAKVHAAYLASRLAELVRGDATFLPAPGLVDSAEVRQVLMNDSSIREVIESFDEITLALVGIGTVEPSPLLASSGNIFSAEELDMLRENGAVGDILYRFFDAEGNPVQTPLADRVTGMDLDQLQRVERVVGIAGGGRKLAAIRGALEGKLINTLITDRFTAERLIQM
jgi:DNA-binding transcriptional regulator LsrR (DeoR family)